MARVVKTRLCSVLIIAMAGLPCAVSASTTTLTEFPLSANSRPTSITTGPDGNLWFTEGIGNQIGRITSAGAVTEFAIPTAGSQPLSITAGPDGNVWFTES